MKTALVVGGTGPTGPLVVNGLLDRGYEVAIFHGGFHEVEFAGPVEHIHGDTHFVETIQESLGNRTWDVVIIQYGRLRHLANHFKGRAGHVVGIGGAMRLLARPNHPAWGALGRPPYLDDHHLPLEDDAEAEKFGWRMAEALRTLFEAGQEGGYKATYIGYPLLYGPRQVGDRDWSVLRRLLDGRKRIIIADAGLKIETRGYVENVATAPLLAIDKPEVADGQSYMAADRSPYTIKQRILFMAKYLNRDIELIDMPFELAKPIHPFYRNVPGHLARSTEKIRSELGYVDRYTPEEGMGRTIDWLIANQPEPGGETELQLGDPFDYEREDFLIDAWQRALAELPDMSYEMSNYAHGYRIPKSPNENWVRPKEVKRWLT